MTSDQKLKSHQLIHYLDIYIRKPNLQMKPIIFQIKKRLTKGELISHKQFLSIIKFIEREPRFVRSDRDTITSFFSPLIKELSTDHLYIQNEPVERSTLEKFFI